MIIILASIAKKSSDTFFNLIIYSNISSDSESSLVDSSILVTGFVLSFDFME